jgi:hypothetical protein
MMHLLSRGWNFQQYIPFAANVNGLRRSIQSTGVTNLLSFGVGFADLMIDDKKR